MEKWIFENRLPPGDVVMLTAALRDLHRLHPGRFLTDVRTCHPALWENNPHLTPLSAEDADTRSLECHYPLIHRSNQEPWHFIHGFSQYIGEKLGVPLHPTAFRGDIHLSEEEKARPSPVEEVLGHKGPYWILAAGGKYDFTIKWWHRRRWQEVVDHFQGRVRFVQIGQTGHYHPPMRGVSDMRGKTTLRDLVRLVYHADGILCPVTLHMHLAAAVPLPPGRTRARACVVINGGREPAHWEAYPGHHFLHTIGSLDCCAQSGCWKSRTVALGDGSVLDSPAHLCVNVGESGIARCMELIDSALVCRMIELSLH